MWLGDTMSFRVHPIFVLFALVSIGLGHAVLFACYMVALLLHEAAHSFVAKKLGYSLNKLVLLPQGAQLSGLQSFVSTSDEIKIALAGPFFNLFLAVVIINFWWVFPITYAFTNIFVICNLSIAVFNLMPILPLDGARTIVAIFAHFKKRKLGILLCKLFGVIACLVLLALFVISVFYKVNFSFLISAVFLSFPVLSKNHQNIYEQAYQTANKMLQKSPAGKVNSFAVKSEETLLVLVKQFDKNKYNIAYIVDSKTQEIIAKIFENELVHILQNNELNKKICEVL